MKRIGVVGLGLSNPYFYAPILESLGARVTAVWDHTYENAKDYAQQFNCELVNTLDSFPLDTIDGVLIESVNADHLHLAEHFIKRGIPTYIEKPLSHSPTEALRFLELHKEACFFSSSPLRFAPPYLMMQQDLKNVGERPLLTRIVVLHTMKHFLSNPTKIWHDDPKQSGGMLVDIGIHGIELLNMFMQSQVKEINHLQLRSHYSNAQSYDNHLVTLHYEDESAAQLVLLCATEELDYSAEVYTLNHAFINSRCKVYQQPEKYDENNAYGGFVGTMQAFIKMIETRISPIDHSETRRNFQLLEKILSTAQEE